MIRDIEMNNTMLDRITWNNALAQLIAQTGHNDFLIHFSEVLESISPYKGSIIVGYIKGVAPIILHSDLTEKDRQLNLSVYMKGGYLIDPFYLAAQEKSPEGLYHLDDMVPDEFYQTEYYLTYYQKSPLKDEMGLLIHLSDEKSVIIWLGLRDDFIGDVEYASAQIESVKSIIIELARKHFQQSTFTLQPGIESDNSTTELSVKLNIAFTNFGRDVLSEREREIVLLVLKGYSSKAIARLLEISPETVKVHRKRIHTKLDISSQCELFSLFIASLSMIENDLNADPLALYLADLEK